MGRWVARAIPAMALAAAGACSSSSEERGSTGGLDPAQVQKFCEVDQQLSCHLFSDLETCKTDMTADGELAAAHGCLAEERALVQCQIDHPMACTSSGPSLDPECVSHIESLTSCTNGTPVPDASAECSSGGVLAPDGGSSCGWACSGFGMTCSGEPMACTCTTGPKQGTTFTPAGDPCNDDTIVKSLCL